MKQAAENGLEGFVLKHSVVDEEVMSYAKENNLEVLSLVVDETEAAKRLIEIGVTGIITNRPKWLKEEMDKY